MFNIIKRATDICKMFKIDPGSVTEIKDVYEMYKGVPTLYGTVLKYMSSEETPMIHILLLSGWHKDYVCKTNADAIRIVRDLQHNSFTQSMIGQVLGISQGKVSQMARAKNIARKDE